MTKRWLYVVLGMITMLLAGFVYAWSVISGFIAAEFSEWTTAQLSLTFTICMASFCVSGFATGILSRKVSVRVLLRISAGLFLLAFCTASRMRSLTVLYISYGLLGGCAAGFVYISIMNTVPRWVPEHSGLVSGLLLMGFGISSLLIGSIFSRLSSRSVISWRSAILWIGVFIAAVLFLISFLLRAPRKEELMAREESAAAAESDFSPGQMLGDRSFWLCFVWAVLLSAVGLVLINMVRGISLTVSPQLSAVSVSLIAGLLSTSNGVGRIIFGAVYDKSGYAATMMLVVLSSFLGVAIFALALRGSVLLLCLGCVFIGLGYGGGPTVGASNVKSFFGQTNYGINYSLMSMNLLPASFSPSLAGAIYDQTKSYPIIFAMMTVCLVICLMINFLLRKNRISIRRAGDGA